MTDLGCSPNAAVAYKFLIDRGLRDYQAAAVVGNLQFESGLDPTLAIMDTNGQMSRGIAMWQPPRWAQLLAFAGSHDPLAFNVQLEFLWVELPNYGLSSLLASSRLQDAVVIFQDKFEKPNAALAHTDQRIIRAQAVLFACPAVTPPETKVGGTIAAVALGAFMAAVGYGTYKLLEALKPKPEPTPLPPPAFRPRSTWGP